MDDPQIRPPDLRRPEPPDYAPDQGLVIAQYGYAMLNRVIGLVVTGLLAALGAELLFVHKFIPVQPGKGFQVFGWLALGLGVIGALSAIKGLAWPKPAITVTDQGLAVNIAGFGGKPLLIPWGVIKSIRQTRMQNAGTGRLNALGLTLDPTFPLPAILALARSMNNGELTMPVGSLNETPENICAKVREIRAQYQPLT